MSRHFPLKETVCHFQKIYVQSVSNILVKGNFVDMRESLIILEMFDKEVASWVFYA